MLIVRQHYISYIKHAIFHDFVTLRNLLCNRVSMSHDIGDKYSTFQSLDTRNLPSTDSEFSLIRRNSFSKNMVDKRVWRINWIVINNCTLF